MKTKTVIFIVVLISFCNCFLANTPVSKKIEGVWKVTLSQKINLGSTLTLIPGAAKSSEMKIWSKGYFAYVGKLGNGQNCGGGSYKFEGNNYTETVLYHPDETYIGSTVMIKLELKKDTLIQIWPVDKKGQYNKDNYNIVKMVKLK